MPPLVQKLDADKDGKISKEELSTLAAKFDELDENKDGSLDARELLGPPPQGGQPGGGPEGPPGGGEGGRGGRFGRGAGRPLKEATPVLADVVASAAARSSRSA